MATLSEITGKALPGEWGSEDETGTGTPVLRTTNFNNNGTVNYDNVVTRTINTKKKGVADKFLRYGDIIIEKSGGSDKQPVGRVMFFEGPEQTYLFNNFTGLLRVKNQNIWLPKYVFYSLFANYCSGGTRRYENKTTGLHNLKTDDYVCYYNIPEKAITQQQLICEQLDKIRFIIDSRRQELVKLDELVKARFVEMFGDPIINKKGFAKVRLDSEADIKIGPFGSLLHQGDYIENGHALVNPSHIIDGSIQANPKLTISNEKYENLSAYHLKVDDIVMGRRGEMGRCAVVRENGLLCGTGSLIIRTKGSLKADFIQKVISFPSYKRMIEDKAVGQTMQNLNVQIVSALEIIKPPKKIQESYYSFVAQVDKSKFVVQQQIRDLQELFDKNMDEYFGGNDCCE